MAVWFLSEPDPEAFLSRTFHFVDTERRSEVTTCRIAVEKIMERMDRKSIPTFPKAVEQYVSWVRSEERRFSESLGRAGVSMGRR